MTGDETGGGESDDGSEVGESSRGGTRPGRVGDENENDENDS